ncbi:MAG: ABC transporter substrate-binding protein [Clostridiaceae bacterium BRH_c20a]|nr:MAG: ABC transporter substrate-binding protein [Clostridiaceae bacterium BRH_c20a]
MKKIIIMFIVTVMLITLFGCGNSQTPAPEPSKVSQEPSESSPKVKILKAGIGLNDKHPQHIALLKFKEIVEEKTNGAIVIQTYHSGSLGDDRQMIQDLQLGSLDITIPATAPLANFAPEFNILNFPFLFQNDKVADKVLDGQIGEEMLKKLPAAELVGLSYWEEGFYNISNNVRPINSAGDLKGIKIRTMENQILLDVFKALGANPTPMAFGEVFTALQQGVVDAQTNPLSQIYEAKFHEVQKYISKTNDLYGVWVFLMSKATYDGLTPEQQEIVKEASIVARDYERKLTRDSENEYKEKLIAEGVQYNDVAPEALTEMQAIIQPVLDKYAAELEPDFVKRFFKAVKEAQ